MKNLLIAAAACALVAGCDQPGADNSLAQASATGNEASASVANAVLQSDATSLQKDQALALMKQRHENYERIGDAMKVVSRELKGDSPDLDQVRANADVIAALAPQIPGWFPAGTGPDVGKTEAKAEIWQKPDDFRAKAAAFNSAAQAFQAAARGSDVGAIKAAHGNLGKSCKACHDLYREEH
jgi:cytochrome c556